MATARSASSTPTSTAWSGRCGPGASRPGDSVALMCTNRPEFLEVLYAAQRAGLRLTPINWHLTGEEAAYIVDNCEAKAFIGATELGDKIAEASALTEAEASGDGCCCVGDGRGGDGAGWSVWPSAATGRGLSHTTR